MGRCENPIAPCDKALRALAQWLRKSRTQAGLTYTDLADRTRHLALPGGVRVRCSADTLARAASGASIPRLKTVLAYARSCGADPAEAERLWKRARYQQSLATRRHEEPAPHIHYVRNFAELRAALLDLYRKDGSRPYKELERASEGALSHSTLARVISGITGRPTREFVLAFAHGCGVRSAAALNAWGQAWDRAEEQRLKGGRGAAVQQEAGPKAGGDYYYLKRVRMSADDEEVWLTMMGIQRGRVHDLHDSVWRLAAAMPERRGPAPRLGGATRSGGQVLYRIPAPSAVRRRRGRFVGRPQQLTLNLE
ncbi:helix-turn-helix domain-containing protein [Streptomyces triculaminicus]|uniref:helix-turn-helix domain-containing protein n=1 Tax=Streptomyces triculaminicus TaxID=2816232 RepID=UPI0037B6464B